MQLADEVSFEIHFGIFLTKLSEFFLWKFRKMIIRIGLKAIKRLSVCENRLVQVKKRLGTNMIKVQENCECGSLQTIHSLA